MKKYFICLVLAGSLLLQTGCGNRAQKLANEQSYRQIGLNQLQAGDYESAVHAFDKALNEHTGKVTNLEEDINFYKAYAQMESGDTDGGIATYSALIDYNKRNADAYYLRGCAYMELDNVQAAVEDFKQAARYQDDNGQMYAGIYEQLAAAGLLEEAEVYLERGLRIKGSSAGECFSRGKLCLASGEYTQAEEEFKQALEQGELTANLYLGELAEKRGDMPTAQGYYEDYAEGHPDDPKVLYALGKLEFTEGRYEAAYEYFKQGLECKSIVYRQEIWAGMIAALEYTGDFKGAKEEMEKYLQVYPEDGAANREYLFLHSRVE